jgi:hypothetical protein
VCRPIVALLLTLLACKEESPSVRRDPEGSKSAKPPPALSATVDEARCVRWATYWPRLIHEESVVQLARCTSPTAEVKTMDDAAAAGEHEIVKMCRADLGVLYSARDVACFEAARKIDDWKTCDFPRDSFLEKTSKAAFGVQESLKKMCAP